jgi:hypothetical protein
MSEHEAHDTSDLPPPSSELDTGRRTRIDDLADYVAAVDNLTGAVRGVEVEMGKLPTLEQIQHACSVGAAEGAKNAMIAFVTRLEQNEQRLSEMEANCSKCRTLVSPKAPRIASGFSLRPDHVTVSIWHRVRYQGKGTFALAAVFVLVAGWVAVEFFDTKTPAASTAEIRKATP